MLMAGILPNPEQARARPCNAQTTCQARARSMFIGQSKPCSGLASWGTARWATP